MVVAELPQSISRSGRLSTRFFRARQLHSLRLIDPNTERAQRNNGAHAIVTDHEPIDRQNSIGDAA